jgi:hypothetical protein
MYMKDTGAACRRFFVLRLKKRAEKIADGVGLCRYSGVVQVILPEAVCVCLTVLC